MVQGRVERRAKAKRRAKRILVVTIFFLFFMLLGCSWLYSRFRDTASFFPSVEPIVNDDTGTGLDESFDKDIVNFALLGFDRSADRDAVYRVYRPDTIMIASVNFKTKEIAVINIPRDSYVQIAGSGGYDKINAAYMYGYDRAGKEEDPHQSGLHNTIRTIQNFLGGVPIHYYATVDMDGVVEIIDLLGGIYYDVEFDIRDWWSGYNLLLLSKGYQLLDGKDFLTYARYRGVGGDYGRIERQQKLLIEALRQLKEKGKLKHLPRIYNTLTENVETNLSFSQITALALFAGEIDLGSIKTYTFPGETVLSYSQAYDMDLFYLVINEASRVEYIKKVFGVEVPRRAQIYLPGPRGEDPALSEIPSGPDFLPEEDEPSPEEPSGEEAPGDGNEENDETEEDTYDTETNATEDLDENIIYIP